MFWDLSLYLLIRKFWIGSQLSPVGTTPSRLSLTICWTRSKSSSSSPPFLIDWIIFSLIVCWTRPVGRCNRHNLNRLIKSCNCQWGFPFLIDQTIFRLLPKTTTLLWCSTRKETRNQKSESLCSWCLILSISHEFNEHFVHSVGVAWMSLMYEYIIVTQVHWDDGAHRWRGQWKRVPNQTAQVDPFEHPFTLDGWNTIAPCSRSHKFGYLDGWDTIAPYSQSHIFAGSTTRRRLQNMVLKVSLRWSTLTRLTSQELNIEKIKQTHSLIKNKTFLSSENSKPLLWGAGHRGHIGVDDRANRGKKVNFREK